MSDCSGQAVKGLSCGLVVCANLAVETTDRIAVAEQSGVAIGFPLAPRLRMPGATLAPDPFPPRMRHLA